MTADERNHGAVAVSLFNKPPQGRGYGIPKYLAEISDECKTWRGGSRFCSKAVCQKKELTSCVISLGFYDLVTSWSECLLGVAEHHISVPWDNAMTDFVRFVPAVLDLGEIFVE